MPGGPEALVGIKLSKKTESGSEVIAAFIIGIVSIIIKGFVLVKLWEWFIVYQFHLPSLTIPLALGITIIVSMLTYQYIPDRRNILEQAISTLSFYIAALSFGFVYHLFI